VARFCAGLDDLAPAIQLRLVQLRRALDEVTDRALDSGMAAAKAEGWGLRQIGGQVGLSHERSRYRLARAASEPAGLSQFEAVASAGLRGDRSWPRSTSAGSAKL
jgi:hypothetical protein